MSMMSGSANTRKERNSVITCTVYAWFVARTDGSVLLSLFLGVTTLRVHYAMMGFVERSWSRC